MVVFAFALGLSLPFALVQVIDFHVVIMNLMSSRVPLFLKGVPLNESTRTPAYVGVAPRLNCTCDRKDGISDLIRVLIKRRYPTGSVVAAEHLAVSFSHIWSSSMNFPPRRSGPTAGF